MRKLKNKLRSMTCHVCHEGKSRSARTVLVYVVIHLQSYARESTTSKESPPFPVKNEAMEEITNVMNR